MKSYDDVFGTFPPTGRYKWHEVFEKHGRRYASLGSMTYEINDKGQPITYGYHEIDGIRGRIGARTGKVQPFDPTTLKRFSVKDIVVVRTRDADTHNNRVIGVVIDVDPNSETATYAVNIHPVYDVNVDYWVSPDDVSQVQYSDMYHFESLVRESVASEIDIPPDYE